MGKSVVQSDANLDNRCNWHKTLTSAATVGTAAVLPDCLDQDGRSLTSKFAVLLFVTCLIYSHWPR